MNRFKPALSLVLLAGAALLGLASAKKKTGTALPGIAVVELFTSEGCSSCPPADEALAEADKAYTGHVYVLGFHVDYWDRLGWKDPFSNASWTDRQNRYAEKFKLTSIYTPQAVVNGATQFTGSEKNRLFATIEKELKQTPGAAPDISATMGSDKNIHVFYKTVAAPGHVLNIALVQRNADTQVKRGENEGKLLHHINIVRGLSTSTAASGELRFRLPDGLTPAGCLIIGFVQDKGSLAITAAAETTIH